MYIHVCTCVYCTCILLCECTVVCMHVHVYVLFGCVHVHTMWCIHVCLCYWLILQATVKLNTNSATVAMLQDKVSESRLLSLLHFLLFPSLSPSSSILTSSCFPTSTLPLLSMPPLPLPAGDKVPLWHARTGRGDRGWEGNYPHLQRRGRDRR